MIQTQPTTPFGRRSLSLAMVATQAVAKACPDDAAGHKWKVFRNLTEAKDRLGLSDRSLAVLSALLTFHPDTALTTGIDLVVFPSNRELSIRAHGPAPATLRRALALLVESGVVIRRDSPNGKRYVRRGEGGQVEQAFGFDLMPLVARAAEFQGLADEVRAEVKARVLLREEVSLHRRDIAKTIAFAFMEELEGPWRELADRFAQLGKMPPRSASHEALSAIVPQLRALSLETAKCLAESLESERSIGSESQCERHQQNSKPDFFFESEPNIRERMAEGGGRTLDRRSAPPRTYPLGMVLRSCPDMTMYARDGIAHWHDLVTTAEVVRKVLGVSPNAWEDARKAMGPEPAAIVIACILQKGTAVNSAGAYLRKLTELARAGKFSLGPMLMALMRPKEAGEENRRRA